MIVDMKKYMISCIASLLSLSLFPVQVSCDVPDESSHPVIPVSLSPIDTAHAIREQVKDAALRVEAETLQQIQLVEQLESVMNAQRDAMDTAMNASPDAPGQNAVSQEEIAAPDPAPADVSWTGTVLINTADTVPADSSRMETEAQTEKEAEKRPETETETQLSEETEAQFHPSQIGDSLPNTGDPLPGPHETETETETEQDLPAEEVSARHGVFSMPPLGDLGEINEARINLLDYVMLREYPLSRLPKDLHTLSRLLQEQVGAYDGTWSVYVQNLSTGQDLIINDIPMRSASVMKLFIMETVYEAFDRGDLPRNEDTVYLLRSMIINSSNESSNRLLTLLGDGDIAAGVARVNEFIRLRGFSDGTIEYNGFEDPAASLDPDHPNQITAKDVGLMLGRIYRRSFISRKICNEIEQMMLDQATRYKIPRGLPEGEGAQCGNKSGETDTIANDAAVVYGPTTDYILVVLSNDWSSEDTANAQIAEVSRTVYQFFEH